MTFDTEMILRQRIKTLESRNKALKVRNNRLDDEIIRARYYNLSTVLDWVDLIKHRLHIDEYVKIKNILT